MSASQRCQAGGIVPGPSSRRCSGASPGPGSGSEASPPTSQRSPRCQPAPQPGGGLFAAESSTLLALRDVQIGSGGDAIQGNAANGDASFSGGGGIALYSGAALLGTDVAFAFNECPHGFGGALLLYLAQAALASTPPSQPATDDPRTRFTDNRATNQHGGAIYAFDSQLSVQNAAFLGNLA